MHYHGSVSINCYDSISILINLSILIYSTLSNLTQYLQWNTISISISIDRLTLRFTFVWFQVCWGLCSEKRRLVLDSYLSGTVEWSQLRSKCVAWWLSARQAEGLELLNLLVTTLGCSSGLLFFGATLQIVMQETDNILSVYTDMYDFHSIYNILAKREKFR